MSVDSKLLKSGKPKSKPTMADVAGEKIKSPRRKGYMPGLKGKKGLKGKTIPKIAKGGSITKKK